MDNLTEKFKEIYVNFVKNNYLFVLSIVKDRNVAIKIIKASFESIFIVDNYKENINNVHNEITKVEYNFAKEYYLANKSKVDAISLFDVDFSVPIEVLHYFTFKTWVLQNDIVNSILIYHIICNLTFKKISTIVNKSEMEVLDLYNRTIQRIKVSYKEKMKEQVN